MTVTRDEEVGIPAMPTPAGTCAVVVLFNPDDKFLGRLQTLSSQFSKMVLIDNTLGGAALGDLPGSISIIRNASNLGIAKALNQGIAFAIEIGCDWVATFDQDSELLPGYLDEVIAIANRYAPRPVLVGCNYVSADSNKVMFPVPRGAKDACRRVTLITSGTFMPAFFSRDIGGFREDYFIDSVDHEFCLRARHYGAEVLMTREPFMRHQMGISGVGYFGFLFSLQHPPVRRYYIARNTLRTIYKYGWCHPGWALRHVRRLLGEGVAIVVIEEQKRAKLRAFLRGLWDGILGRSGPYPYA